MNHALRAAVESFIGVPHPHNLRAQLQPIRSSPKHGKVVEGSRGTNRVVGDFVEHHEVVGLVQKSCLQDAKWRVSMYKVQLIIFHEGCPIFPGFQFSWRNQGYPTILAFNVNLVDLTVTPTVGSGADAGTILPIKSPGVLATPNDLIPILQ